MKKATTGNTWKHTFKNRQKNRGHKSKQTVKAIVKKGERNQKAEQKENSTGTNTYQNTWMAQPRSCASCNHHECEQPGRTRKWCRGSRAIWQGSLNIVIKGWAKESAISPPSTLPTISHILPLAFLSSPFPLPFPFPFSFLSLSLSFPFPSPVPFHSLPLPFSFFSLPLFLTCPHQTHS